jgi:hypothetical protein
MIDAAELARLIKDGAGGGVSLDGEAWARYDPRGRLAARL